MGVDASLLPEFKRKENEKKNGWEIKKKKKVEYLIRRNMRAKEFVTRTLFKNIIINAR